MKTLFCFYDMAVSPCSYDFFIFLYSAENCRIRRGLENIQLIFIQGPNKKFRQDNIRTDIQNDTFFNNVIIPGLSILPSIESFMWVSRETLKLDQFSPNNIFPKGYSLSHPIPKYSGVELVCSQIRGDEPSFFQAPLYATKHFDEYLREKIPSKQYVTITAREITRDDKNNTRSIDFNVWKNVANELQALGITLLVIRDTDAAYEGHLIEGALELTDLSIHLPLRQAAYEGSIINFTKNNGPAVLQLFGKCKTVYFNQFDQDVVALTSDWYKNQFGMVEGANFPMTTKDKKVSWAPEEENLILKYIEEAKSSELKLELNNYSSQENLAISFGVALQSLLDNLKYPSLPEDQKLFQQLAQINEKNKYVSQLKTKFLDIAQKLNCLENGKIISS